MRRIQSFRVFESSFSLNDEQISLLNDCTGDAFFNREEQGERWTLNKTTGLVDVKGSFKLLKYYTGFKGIRFGEVAGDFDCGSRSLLSLEGCPHTVGGNFDCSDNYLRSLQGGSRTVGRTFDCSNNMIESLEGSPTVGRDFNCSDNDLQTLEGGPETVGEDFFCGGNPLKSLKGAPETIGGGFYSTDLKVYSDWSLLHLLKLLKIGTGSQKKLLKTLVGPKELQERIDQNPEKMLVKFKSYLNEKWFKELGLKWPGHLRSEVDLLGDLEGIGL